MHTQSYNLTQLFPDSSYTVNVTAINEFGSSTIERLFNFTTISIGKLKWSPLSLSELTPY